MEIKTAPVEKAFSKAMVLAVVSEMFGEESSSEYRKELFALVEEFTDEIKTLAAKYEAPVDGTFYVALTPMVMGFLKILDDSAKPRPLN